jgi:hypothetical protein
MKGTFDRIGQYESVLLVKDKKKVGGIAAKKETMRGQWST